MRIFFACKPRMTLTEFIASEESGLPHYMVLGNPISHSYSPLMHNYAISYHSLSATYFPVQLLETEIQTCVSHMRKEHFLGANITIPYKEWFLSLVDELSEEAGSIGAINTLVKRDGKIIGHNTDGYGFLKPLQPFMDMVVGERAIIFGSGGATKSIIYSLQTSGIQEIFIVTRNPDIHRNTFDDTVIYTSYDAWEDYAPDSSLIINTTPLGMYPNVQSSPVESTKAHLLSGKLCYDIVYNPKETFFLEQAKEHEATCIGGLDMLIYQGAKAFELWTGKSFPVNEVRKELMGVI